MKKKKKIFLIAILFNLIFLFNNCLKVKALEFQEYFPNYGCISNYIWTNDGGYFKNNYYWYRTNSGSKKATVYVENCINETVDNKDRIISLAWQRPDGSKSQAVSCSYNNKKSATTSFDITSSGTQYFYPISNGEVSEYHFWYDTRIDNYAPIISSFKSSATSSDINLTYSVNDTYSKEGTKGGCGTKQVQFTMYPKGLSESNAITYSEKTDDGTFSATRPVPSNLSSYYGEWICKVVTEDNLGNKATYSYTFNRENKLNPSPNVKAEITKYDYMENKYKVWIKAGNDTQFKITSWNNSDYTNAYKNYQRLKFSDFPDVKNNCPWVEQNYNSAAPYSNKYGYPYATISNITLNGNSIFNSVVGMDGKYTQNATDSGFNYSSQESKIYENNGCGTVELMLNFKSSNKNMGEPLTVSASALTLHPIEVSETAEKSDYNGNITYYHYNYTNDVIYGYMTGSLYNNASSYGGYGGIDKLIGWNKIDTSYTKWVKEQVRYVSEINDRSLYVDGAGPTCEKLLRKDYNVNSVNFEIQNIIDYANTTTYNDSNAKSGSGVKNVEIALVPDTEKNFDKNGSKYYKEPITDISGKELMYNYDSNNNYFGYYTPYIRLTDNVGNTTIYKFNNIIRPEPTPSNVEVDLIYDPSNENIYKDNANRVWIKNDVNVKYSLTATSSSDYSKIDEGYPTKLSYYFNRYDKNKTIKTSKDIEGEGTYNKGVKAFNYKNVSNTLPYVNYNIYRGTSNYCKYLKTDITVKGVDISNNTGFMPYVTASTEYNNIEYPYKSGYVQEKDGEYLFVDSKAPLYTEKSLDRQKDYFTVTLTGVRDNESGLKSVAASVWVEGVNGTQLYKKNVEVSKNSDNTYQLKVNKSDFNNCKKNFKYEITLTDNVGNTTKITNDDVINMICYNLKADRIRIYEPREKRYVTQVVSGLSYQAEIKYSNTEIDDINDSYNIKLHVTDGTEHTITGKPLKSGASTTVSINFTAGEENLKGEVYEAFIDCDNDIEEEDETDNKKDTASPYSKDVSDDNPPKLPTKDDDYDDIPVITVKLDLVAQYLDVVGLEEDTVEDELIADDTYRVKVKVLNNSSLNIKFLDIKNKSFNNEIYYDNKLIDKYNVNDIGAGEQQEHYKKYQIPLLPDNVDESIKQLVFKVDSDNRINEMDEDNNIKTLNKNVLSLKVIDYRITEMVYPMYQYTYPIFTQNMPAYVKSGYNVTFRCEVKGKPQEVYATLYDSNGNDFGKIDMKKVADVDSNTATYEYVFTVPLNLPKETIVYSKVYAKKNSTVYNYNKKENWNGTTLVIDGSALEDILVFRKI